MQIVTFSRNHLRPIALFDAIGASNLRVGGGSGESHVYALRFEPGGSVGAHPAGYGQLFLVVEGQAWAAGADGARVPLSAGEGAYFSPGELTDAIRNRGGVTFLPPAAIGGEDVVDAAAEREWPLRLVSFTPPEVNVAGGPNQPALFELLGQPESSPWQVWAEVSPETAKKAGLENGSTVRITSAAGSIDALAVVVEGMASETVAVSYVPAIPRSGRWAHLLAADVRRLWGRGEAAAPVSVRLARV